MFTRGLRSEHTQVLLDGIPINQGLAGLFNFADLTVDNIDRIEVVRGPQSTLYGPRALAGAIQIFTRQRERHADRHVQPSEGGSFETLRGSFTSSGGSWSNSTTRSGSAVSTTENERPNNEYRLENGIANVGWSPNDKLRIGSLFTYSLADTGNPNSIFDPKPIDNFLTERWLVGPRINFRPVEWWDHQLIVAYDHERQVNDPNEDFFVGPTRALFKRFTLDYQNNAKLASWLTLTTGTFYSDVDAGQERPFISQEFGPQPTFISDHTEQSVRVRAGERATDQGPEPRRRRPLRSLQSIRRHLDLSLRRQLSHRADRHDAAREHRDGVQSAEQPGQNLRQQLRPRAGAESRLGRRASSSGSGMGGCRSARHTSTTGLSNVIGFNGLFETLNLGAARTQGVEAELKLRPIQDLVLTATYTYLDAEKTSAADINQPQGARLPRRPRHEGYASATYLWFGKLRTTVGREVRQRARRTERSADRTSTSRITPS